MEHAGRTRRQAYRKSLLILFEKCVVRAELLKKLDRIDRAVPVEVEKPRNSPELSLELLVARADELGIAHIRTVDSLIDATANNLIEVHARSPRKLPQVHGQRAAHVVLVVRAVIGERHRNQKIGLIVSDEVENNDELLAGRLAEAAAELLNEDDRTLRRTKHDDLIDFGNVHAFGENVHREDVVEAVVADAVRQAVDRLFAHRLIVLARERNRLETALIEKLGKLPAFLIAGAKNQALDARTAPTEVLSAINDVVNAFRCHQETEVAHVVQKYAAHRDVPHAEIMERTQKILFQCGLQTDFVGNVVVEERIDVGTVRAVGTCRHAEPELRHEMRHDLAIALSRRTMHFIDDDDVERRRIESLEHMFARERLHRCEDAVRIPFIAAAAKKSVRTIVHAEHAHEAFHRLPGDLLAVHDEEHATGLQLAHGKGCGVGLARAGCRNEQCAALTRIHNLQKILNEGTLH